MVRLDAGVPLLFHRLIEDLEENVWELAVFDRHVPEEGLGLLNVLVSIVVVPVDDDVEALNNGSVHDCLQPRALGLWVLQVSAILNGHGRPHESYVPVRPQPAHSVVVPELGHPVGPEHGHPVKMHRQACLAADDLVTLHFQVPVLLHSRRANRRCPGNLGHRQARPLQQHMVFRRQAAALTCCTCSARQALQAKRSRGSQGKCWQEEACKERLADDAHQAR
mmetsp:Transcript_80159/g.235788  ORF Transcript_80159/g.235788 Transcript_80159/m.235788 type:complete len:222 (-) Transcript_80159:83-748(-)